MYDQYLVKLASSELLACAIEEIYSQDGEFRLFSGIGDEVVDTFRKDILCGGIIDKLEEKKHIIGIPQNVIDALELKVEVSTNLFDTLPIYIKQDWINLCQTVLAWGCCSLDTQIIINY